jgi:hypothetical protein
VSTLGDKGLSDQVNTHAIRAVEVYLKGQINQYGGRMSSEQLVEFALLLSAIEREKNKAVDFNTNKGDYKKVSKSYRRYNMTQVNKAIEVLEAHPEGVAMGTLANRIGTTMDGVRAVVSQVRKAGYAVYANEGKLDSRGRQLATRYRIGTPTKAMVAHYFNSVGAKRGRT